MTIGERFAWIWVWGAIALISLTLVVISWRYWDLPSAYFESLRCGGQDQSVAISVCEHLAAAEDAPVELRSKALRRLIEVDRTSPETKIKRLSLLLRLGNATAEDWNNRAISYFSLRQFDKAADDFQQAATMNDAVGIYWSNLADAEIELKKYGQAYDHYTIAIDKGDDSAEILGNRGWASYQLGNDEKAHSDYIQAIAKDPQHGDNLNERGLVRHALGEYESALGDFDQALTLKPDSPVILTNRALTHIRLGDNAKAGEDLDRAIGLDPKYELARVEKTWLLINQGQSADALEELKAIEGLGPLSLSALEARSRASLDLADWQTVIADADQALAQGSSSDWPYEYRARAKRGIRDYEGSVADATVLITRNPKNMNMLVTRAISLHLADRTELALADMNMAIEQNIDPAYAYEMKSYLNLGLGRVKEAVADARQSVNLAPQSQHSTAMLGWALLEDKDPSAAIEACGKSLTIVPTSGAYACRAMALLDLHKMAEAATDARKAFDLDQQSSAGYFALGRIDLAQGRASEAVKRFDLALKFDVFNPAEILMYRGDAERARGDHDKARLDYQEARKQDLGLYAKALDERLASLPAQ